MKVIKFDKAMLLSLKRAVEAAIMRKEETFIFEGNEFLTDYAKFLVEYLEDKL